MTDCTMCKHEQDGSMRDYCKLLKAEINSMGVPICQRKCASCHWWADDVMVCVNSDSEWVADFRLADDSCEEWEEKKNDRDD